MNRIEPLSEGRCDFIYTIDLGKMNETWLFKMVVLEVPLWLSS